MFKKVCLLFLVIMLMVFLGGCSHRNVFSLKKDTVKIVVEKGSVFKVTITEEEDVKAIVKIFHNRSTAKTKGMVNSNKYTYCVNSYDDTGIITKYFYLDPEFGGLFKIGSYSSWDIFKTNHCFLANLLNEELELFLSIVDKYEEEYK